MRVDVYSRHDAFVGSISPGELIAFVHTDELNGEDSVAISTTFHLREGYRLVWRDRTGKAHEHICQDPRGTHDGSGVVYSDTALNSICELFGDFIEDKRPHGYTFQAALQVALQPTRWGVGTVDQTGNVDDGLTFYHTSAREAVQAILECGGELDTQVTVGPDGVSARKVSILAHRGTASGHRRFEFGKDCASVSKTEHWSAITACYGYGKGLETGDGGYSRKLTIYYVNGKKDYVEDKDALAKYGRPDGNGGLAHVFGKFEDPDCDDPLRLRRETEAYLDAHKEPGVTYEADVLDLVQFGRDWEGVAVGDDVQLVDRDFSPELRCAGRVTKLVTDMLGGSQTVTLGNVTETMADWWAQQRKEVGSLSRRSGNWDVAASTPAAYLQQVIDGLNEQFNMSGMSYRFDSFELGTIYSSVPMDEAGRPKSSGGWAMQLCSAGFRIANGTKADGSWNWRTFGTGNGFTADEITAGTIKGGSNTWNLGTGDLQFKQGSIVINGPSNTQVRIDATNGFRVTQNGRLVGGLEIVGGQAHLRAARAGTTAANYMTTGTTQGGNPGASFVNSSGNYLDVESLRAVDDPTNATTGVGLAVFDRPFLDASTYYNRLWLHRPGTSQTYMEHPPEQLYIGDNSVHLQYSGSCGAFVSPTAMSFRWNDSAGLLMGGNVFSYVRNKQDQALYMQDDMISFQWSTGCFEITNDHAIMKFNDSAYVELTPSGLLCRHGSTGFRHTSGGWEELTW